MPSSVAQIGPALTAGRWVLLAWVLLLLGFGRCEAAAGEEAAAVEEEEPSLWFPVGEKLTYRVYWGWVPVATSSAESSWVEEEGRRLLAVRFRTKSNRILGGVYPVDDFIESLIDPETFLPVRFTKTLKEGRYRCDEVTHFDHKAGVARWQSKLNGNSEEYPIDGDTRDLISFMYFVRGQSAHFQPGVAESFRVMADEKVYDLWVKPTGKEDITVPDYGKVPSVRFEPEAAFEGLFVRKGKLRLWVSDDARRIVTRVQARIPVASIKIVLAEVSGPGDDFWTRAGRPEEENRGDD